MQINLFIRSLKPSNDYTESLQVLFAILLITLLEKGKVKTVKNDDVCNEKLVL